MPKEVVDKHTSELEKEGGGEMFATDAIVEGIFCKSLLISMLRWFF
jgi:hypothetical protein